VGALLRYLSSVEGLQISKGLGLGNKVDVDESDALAYLTEDAATRIVGLYIEDIRDGLRFLKVARQSVSKKPVLLLKGGRTEKGAKATATHTASLAMDDGILDGALRQAGVIRVGDVEELMATLLGFCLAPLPRGDRIALVTYSGAQAVMSIDTATEEGLNLASLEGQTRQMLSRVIKNSAKSSNPVDMFPDMMTHGFKKTTTQILRALLMDKEVHGIVFISFARSEGESFLPLVEIIKETGDKPVFFSLLGTREDVEADRAFLEQHGIPFYPFPETAVRVFARMWRYARHLMTS
jgi:acetyltransferase